MTQYVEDYLNYLNAKYQYRVLNFNKRVHEYPIELSREKSVVLIIFSDNP